MINQDICKGRNKYMINQDICKMQVKAVNTVETS
jgi:hypothetical protein